MKVAVFVTSVMLGTDGLIVQAANGGEPDGPPMIRWHAPREEATKIHLGKKYILTIKEAD